MDNTVLQLIMFAMIMLAWFMAKRVYNALSTYFWMLTILPVLANTAFLAISMSLIMPNITLREYSIVSMWVVVLLGMQIRGIMFNMISGRDITLETWKLSLKYDYVFWCMGSVPWHIGFFLM